MVINLNDMTEAEAIELVNIIKSQFGWTGLLWYREDIVDHFKERWPHVPVTEAMIRYVQNHADWQLAAIDSSMEPWEAMTTAVYQYCREIEDLDALERLYEGDMQ